MRWVRFEKEGVVRLGIEDGDDILEVSRVGELTVSPGDDPLLDLITAGAPLENEPETAARHARTAIRVLSPIARPPKIIAIGLNYVDHANETGLSIPESPLLFAKFSSSIVGDGDDIVVPTWLTTQPDWEAELALVVGTRRGPSDRATLADVAGWTVANDVSARDLQFGDGQWTRGKSLDTFSPLGPSLVTPDEIPNASDLRVTTTVNGVTMQSASTADLIFGLEFLLDFLSANFTLEPGDVVLTGTPPGVGGFREPPVFLQDGDVVEVAVASIGKLTNRVRYV